MASIVQRIHFGKLAQLPDWLPNNTMYEVITGSMAYGVSSDSSDMDVVGFCIPKKHTIFPHLAGHIQGFGTKPQGFEQFIQHHIDDKEHRKQYDVTIYNIIKYFQLCMENNPNMVDTLFVPINCILHTTNIGNMLRENRKTFLHKGCWQKFKGYSYSTLHKADIKQHPGLEDLVKIEKELNIPKETKFSDLKQEVFKRGSVSILTKLNDDDLNRYYKQYEICYNKSRRVELVKEFGADVKFLYHVVRLLSEVEQILTEGDLDLQRNSEQLKAIRRGEVSFEEVKEYFKLKEKDLETLYHTSKIPHSPNEQVIKTLLLNCLEEHYGSLSDSIVNPDQAIIALREVQEIIRKNQNIL